MLNSYLADTALLLNDPGNLFYSPATLTTLINRARRWLSVRTGYPRVMVTTIATVAGQEAYPLSLANSAVALVAGVAAPFGVWGISVQQGNYYIALGRKDFPSFQADERILDGTLQNYPVVFASYGRGNQAIEYMFPVPAAIYKTWWDLACTPIDLVSDTDTEAIPLPWTEIIPFKAAALGVLTQQRWEDMAAFDDQVDLMLAQATRAEMPFMRPDWYPTER